MSLIADRELEALWESGEADEAVVCALVEATSRDVPLEEERGYAGKKRPLEDGVAVRVVTEGAERERAGGISDVELLRGPADETTGLEVDDAVGAEKPEMAEDVDTWLAELEVPLVVVDDVVRCCKFKDEVEVLDAAIVDKALVVLVDRIDVDCAFN